MTQDLIVKINSVLETPGIFPDEQGRIQITVANRGNQQVRGASVNLYASTDTELDRDNLNTNSDRIEGTDINLLRGTDELLGTLNGINLGANQSRTFTIDFASEDFRTASVVSAGAYHLIAEVDPNNAVAEINERNNQALRFISTEGTDAILDWNSVFLNAVQTDGKLDIRNGVRLTDTSPGAGVAPPLQARDGAILNLAMYEAVNAINGDGSSYLNNLIAPPQGASAEAAAVGAAYRVLTTLYPEQRATFNTQRFQSLAEIQDSSRAESLGFAYGALVAGQILGLRSGDGANRAQVPYTPGNDPGDYPETNENGPVSALFPNWGRVTPFVLDNVADFRPDGPPEFGSEQFIQEFEEIRRLGALRDTDVTEVTRTEDQTEIAQFWAYDRADTFRPPGQWYEIAQEVALDQGNTLEENALLFAQLSVAMADAGIVAWDTKYTFEQLRPFHAITGAGQDNNPNTIEDPNWRPLLNTPPFPDYISGHSTFGGAAARILENFFGEDVALEISSQELPGVTRIFTGSGDISSFEQAAIENANSRLFGGVHFDSSNVDGVTTGQNVADYVIDNFFA
jgi:hypothetical protein